MEIGAAEKNTDVVTFLDGIEVLLCLMAYKTPLAGKCVS
jgi:hypothetical protein